MRAGWRRRRSWGVVVIGALIVTTCAGPATDHSSTTQHASSPATTPGETSTAPAAPAAPADCPTVGGTPIGVEQTTTLATLGVSNDVRVDGALYPHPDYQGNPWSQWGQGLVSADGRFFSAIGDHLGRDGNSYIHEYDPETDRLSLVTDVLSHLDHVAGTWGYGKIHGQLVSGPCGDIFFSTYWGTSSGLEFEGNYRGDVLFRLDPEEMTIDPLQVPVEFHGQASLAGDASRGLVYGEAVDPIERDKGNEVGPFFAYDVTKGQVVHTGPESPHVGFRNLIVDQAGLVYYSTGDGRLAVFDPSTNTIEDHDATLPGDWVRASTLPDSEGRVFGVTRDPEVFFELGPDGAIEELGPAAGYTTSMALSPDGGHFYYMAHAHGSAWRSGAPLIRVDTDTGTQEEVVELGPLVEESLGYLVGGTYNVAVASDGRTVYLGVNASPVEDDSGFGEVILLVVHLP